jgi:hypothetical protein
LPSVHRVASSKLGEGRFSGSRHHFLGHLRTVIKNAVQKKSLGWRADSRHWTYLFFEDIISYLYLGLKLDIISYLISLSKKWYWYNIISFSKKFNQNLFYFCLLFWTTIPVKRERTSMNVSTIRNVYLHSKVTASQNYCQ